MPPARSSAAAPRLSRPAARYRPGKAPVAGDHADLDSSDSDNEAQSPHRAGDEAGGAASSIASGTAGLLNNQRKSAGIVINTSDNVGPARKVDLKFESKPARPPQDEGSSSEYETDSDQGDAPPARPVFQKTGEQVKAPPQPAMESSEYETDSDESDSGSEESEKPNIMLKPVFVSKKARIDASNDNPERSTDQDAEAKAEALAEKRRKEAHDLAEHVIRKQLAEEEHAKRQASSSVSAAADVDDTDGLDPEGEFQAWRLRELQRIKRDQDEANEKRAELEEMARIKALPEAERERLGLARAKALAEEKRQQKTSTNGASGQKYYHKGSFFQDMDILKRDYSEMTERQADKSKMPKSLQGRGDVGVKGKSKWTGLGNEDTSRDALTIGSKQHTPRRN